MKLKLLFILLFPLCFQANAQWCGARLKMQIITAEGDTVTWKADDSTIAEEALQDNYHIISDKKEGYSMSATSIHGKNSGHFEFDNTGETYLRMGCGGSYEFLISRKTAGTDEYETMTCRIWNLCECYLSISIPFLAGEYEYKIPQEKYNTDELMKWQDMSPSSWEEMRLDE